MSEAQESFISSTFWTERVGPTAALATLKEMKRTRSWAKITNLGNYLIKGWKYLGEKYKVDFNISSLPALATMNFTSDKKLEYKTFLTQEMLKKKYLASTLTYLSTAHNHSIIDKYIDELEPIFKVLGECEDGNKIEKFLQTKVCEKGFKRLN
jgi:glutamate-1-semialdehyde 2,1-aminomutase